MPKIKDIIGEVLGYIHPKRRVEAKPPTPPKPAICADMLTIYEWLLKYRCQAPFFCLMLQEGFDSSFLLNNDGEPVIFKDWPIVENERVSLNDPRVWILEIEGMPN